MIANKLPLEEWKLISKEAQRAVFGWETSPDEEECSYAYFFTTKEDTPLGFVTVKEREHETYLQFGGMFDVHKGTPYAYRMLSYVVEDLAAQGKLTISMKVKNTNSPMLRIALKMGFVPVGINLWKNSLFVTMQRGGV